MTTCYMCGSIATENEHVPPKCFFPEEKDLPGTNYRTNLTTVPSCREHNSAKSKDDEYLLFVLTSHFGNNTVAANHIRTKILRALRRRPHLLSIFTKTSKNVMLGGEKTLAFQFDRKRVNRELEHIVRGLHFREFEQRWMERIVVHSPAMMAMEGESATDVNQITRKMAGDAGVFFRDASRKGVHQDVFWYQIHADSSKGVLLARMCFYQGVEVIALSGRELRTK